MKTNLHEQNASNILIGTGHSDGFIQVPSPEHPVPVMISKMPKPTQSSVVKSHQVITPDEEGHFKVLRKDTETTTLDEIYLEPQLEDSYGEEAFDRDMEVVDEPFDEEMDNHQHADDITETNYEVTTSHVEESGPETTCYRIFRATVPGVPNPLLEKPTTRDLNPGVYEKNFSCDDSDSDGDIDVWHPPLVLP